MKALLIPVSIGKSLQFFNLKIMVPNSTKYRANSVKFNLMLLYKETLSLLIGLQDRKHMKQFKVMNVDSFTWEIMRSSSRITRSSDKSIFGALVPSFVLSGQLSHYFFHC